MSSRVSQQPFLAKLISLELSSEDYAVMGGGCLLAHGIIDAINDIDIIARGEAWKKAESLGEITTPQSGKGRVIRLFDDKIEVFDSWAPGNWNIAELIDTAELIDGVRYVTLENVLKWKEIRRSERDLMHVELIKKYISDKGLKI